MADGRVVDMAARRDSADAALRERLLDVYRRAKAADDGRRVSLADLPRAERERM